MFPAALLWEFVLSIRLELCLFLSAILVYYALFDNVVPKQKHPKKAKLPACDLEAKVAPSAARARTAAPKPSAKPKGLEDVRARYRALKAAWVDMGRPSAEATPSMAPQRFATQLVEHACREHALAKVLPDLSGGPAITEEAVVLMLTEAASLASVELTRAVEDLAREQHLPFSDKMCVLLLRGFSGDSTQAARIVDEVLQRDAEISSELSLSIVGFCSETRDIARADQLHQHSKAFQISVLAGLIRFYIDVEANEKACDVYEQHVQTRDANSQQPQLRLDQRLERSVMNAALRCGRDSLARGLLESSPEDIARHITTMRKLASEKDLDGALAVWDTMEQNGIEPNSVIYNTIMDACAECGNVDAAEQWMARTRSAGLADVVSFNTLIKLQLAQGCFHKARNLMSEMQQFGLQPNCVTFNELMNSIVSKGSRRPGLVSHSVWALVKEMEEYGIKPNKVTCSILMKSLHSESTKADFLRTMAFLNNMDEPMDEVLLSSLIEACVRIGQPELVSTTLTELRVFGQVCGFGAHTFGSLIKAFGFAKDMDGAWRCWEEMRRRNVRPTSVTIGCMVEAIVSNGNIEAAYELIREMCGDPRCRDLVNSVVYCSVLKGYARERNADRAWTVYQEMSRKGVDLSVVTFNTLIDACARSGRMERVASILDDMHQSNIKPNVITYSTMLKGYCQAGELLTAFKVLKEMKSVARLKPDEIVYNSLIDGCARSNLVREGLGLLDEMCEEGVAPSNFTLSVLVKLLSRGRRLDHAFKLVEELSAKYKFKVNAHVYANLAQACVNNHSLERGISLLETMNKEKLHPESRMYSILCRASIAEGRYDEVATMLRGALGLPTSSSPKSPQPFLACRDLDTTLVNEILAGMAGQQDLAFLLVSDIKRHRPEMRIEASTQRRLMHGVPFAAAKPVRK